MMKTYKHCPYVSFSDTTTNKQLNLSKTPLYSFNNKSKMSDTTYSSHDHDDQRAKRPKVTIPNPQTGTHVNKQRRKKKNPTCSQKSSRASALVAPKALKREPASAPKESESASAPKEPASAPKHPEEHRHTPSALDNVMDRLATMSMCSHYSSRYAIQNFAGNNIFFKMKTPGIDYNDATDKLYFVCTHNALANSKKMYTIHIVPGHSERGRTDETSRYDLLQEEDDGTNDKQSDDDDDDDDFIVRDDGEQRKKIDAEQKRAEDRSMREERIMNLIDSTLSDYVRVCASEGSVKGSVAKLTVCRIELSRDARERKHTITSIQSLSQYKTGKIIQCTPECSSTKGGDLVRRITFPSAHCDDVQLKFNFTDINSILREAYRATFYMPSFAPLHDACTSNVAKKDVWTQTRVCFPANKESDTPLDRNLRKTDEPTTSAFIPSFSAETSKYELEQTRDLTTMFSGLISDAIGVSMQEGEQDEYDDLREFIVTGKEDTVQEHVDDDEA
jgi:hypothetical protein